MKYLFRAMVDKYQRPVYSQAFYILSNSADAEDATQEAYERFWRALHEGSVDEESAKAWLLHVVRNICIDKLRRRKPLEDCELDDFENCDSSSEPLGHLMHQQLSRWLSSAITQLKEPYRSLILLVDIQQRSIKEVAPSLDLKEGQARVYIHRGRKQLRNVLRGVEL